MLAVASVFTKVLVGESVSPERLKSYEMFNNCIHWRDIAYQDTNIVLRMQHAVTALTFLKSARMLSRDSTLEHMFATDVERLSKHLEAVIVDSRIVLDMRRSNTEELPKQ